MRLVKFLNVFKVLHQTSVLYRLFIIVVAVIHFIVSSLVL